MQTESSAAIPFHECLMAAASNAELVKEFDRLNGTQLSSIGKRSPIDRMIDEATGFEDHELRKFVEFVHRYVYVALNR